MIYTSYFAKLKEIEKLNKNSKENGLYIPISICGKAPEWYNGLQYKKLAPKYNFFMEWKKNQDNDYYIEHFQKEVLDNLEVLNVLEGLYKLLDDKMNNFLKLFNCAPWGNSFIHIVLMCYEKPSDFCHRHLVANWINTSFKKEIVKELEF